MKNILFRVNASKQIGLGHITRCLALANDFRAKGHKVSFATNEDKIAIGKVKEENFELLPNSSYLDSQFDVFIGDVRDGLSIETIEELKEKGVLTVAIDESSDYRKACDLCFYPPVPQVDKLDWDGFDGKIYKGWEYVILRSEFYQKYEKIENKVPNILVMMGGTDANNLTLKIVNKLLELKKDEINVSVIINKNHKDYETIKSIDKKVSVYSDIKNMTEFLTNINFGIISFGVSAYELLAMQIPAIHICLDEDHWKSSEILEREGFATRYKKEDINNIKNLDLDNNLISPIRKNNISNIILNKDKYIISIGAGSEQVPLIMEIKKLGYKVISSDLDKNAPAKGISDIFYNISTYESEKLIEVLKKETVNIVGILTRATGQPIVTVSKIAQEFNIKALDVENALLFSNKSLLMNKLNFLNIPSPNTITVTNTDIHDQKLNFPVFVKPSKTIISHAAMNKCVNEIELKKSLENAIKISETNEANIEEYLIGRDVVSIDFIFDEEIIHITNIGEISSGEPSFDGIGWYSISNDYADIANQSFIDIKNGLKIKNGFLQTAMKVNVKTNSAKIYEVHAEIGGDKVNDVFIPYILNGFNIFEENIKLSVNKKPSYPINKSKLIIMLFENKIKQYDINIKDYKIVDGTFIKEFYTFEELEKELDALKEECISINNYLEDDDR